MAVTLMAVAGLVAWVVTAPTIGDDSMVGRATITASAVAIVALVFALWPNRRSAPGPVEPQASQQAAQRVAHAALDRWENEAHDRRITGPGQLPVPWKWAGSNVATSAEQMNPPHVGPTSGAVTDLVNLYRNLDPNWRKLIILGGPGSGKTAAMVLLLISLLKDRQPGEPVPVWITLGSWNPNKQNLRDYAATVIGRDYPFTREQAVGGERGPKALLDDRRVALFLDGLDEMPAELRAVATQKIDEEHTLPIVMTSRFDEYARAITQKGPYGAVIEMVPLKLDQTIDALKAGHRADRAEVWERFTDRLADEASKAALWTSPLRLSLLRQTYETSGDDPYELFDREKYPNDDAIQATLIERVLDQAYPDPKQRKNATYWLTWIACKLDGTRDIRWWDIPSWGRHFRLTLGAVVGLVVGLSSGIYMGLGLNLRVGLVAGLLVGLLGFGSLGRVQPKSAEVRQLSWSHLLAGLIGGLVLGIAGGAVAGLLLGFIAGLTYGLFVGFGIGLIILTLVILLLLPDELGQPIAGSTAVTPELAYRLDKRFGLITGSLHALLIALLVGLGATLIVGLMVGHAFEMARAIPGAIPGEIVGEMLGESMEVVLLALGGGLAVGLLIGLIIWPWRRPSWLLVVSGIHLSVIYRRRFQPMKLLEKARERQILRQVGSVYQFRHAELQDYLVSNAASYNQRWVDDESRREKHGQLAWADDLAWSGNHH